MGEADLSYIIQFIISKKVGLLVASLRILGRFFQIFFTWAVGGRVRQLCTLGNFQCRSVLLSWIIVGRTVLAGGTDGGYFETQFTLFLSFHID